MEPVEIDFIYGGNTQTEGKKIEMSLEAIAIASEQAKAKFERHQAAVIELKKDLVSLGTSYKQATTKQGKSDILTEIELTKKNIIDETLALKQLKAEMASMSRLKPSAAMPDANTVAKTAMGYNSLGMSVQQVVRELPAASMGLNMFFLAIGNNLPILTDNIKRARLQNDALKNSGQSTVPVWKQLMSSLLSWQSLMMVGITVATMYGKEIVAMFSKGSAAAERAKEDSKKFNETFSSTAGESLAKVNQLSTQWSELGNNLEAKKKFVNDNKDAFRELGVEVNNVKDAENLLVGNVGAFRQAMIAKAMSVAAMETATSKYKEYFKQMREAEKMSETVNVVTSTGGQSITGSGTMQTTTVKNSEKIKAKETAAAIKAEGDSLITESNKQNELYAAFLEKAGIKRYERETKVREKKQKEAYDSERDFLSLIYDLHAKSSDMLLGLQADSLAKRLQDIEFEKQAELKAIEEKQIAIIDAYNRSNKDKKGFKPLSTQAGDIEGSLQIINPEEAKNLQQSIVEIIASYGSKSAAETKKWNDEISKLALEFADERIKIAEEYNAKIVKLEENGQKAAAEAARKERDKKIGDETVSAIKETEIYKMITDEKLNITQQSSEKFIDILRQKMVDAWADGQMTVDQLNAMMDQINNAQDKVQSKKNENNPFAQLKSAISGNTSAQAALKAGLANKNTTPEQLEKLKSAAANATKEMAGAAGAALMGVNQILGSVVDGMDQLGMLTEEEKETANEVIGMVGGAADLAMGIATGNPMQIIQGSIALIVNGLKLFDEKSKAIEKAQKTAKKNLDDLTRAYENLGRAVEDALGTDVYKAQRAQIDNLREQIRNNYRLIEEEYKKSKKKQNAEAIADWKAEIDNLKAQIGDITDAITESLAQTNVKDLATQVSDALVTAFQDGENAASAMGDVVNNVLRNAVINALKLKVLDKLLAPAIDQFAVDMESGNELTGSEADKFKESVTAAGEAYFKALNEANEALGGIFNGDTSGAASGMKGEAAKMTEVTGSALIGQITAMRLNIVAMLANNKDAISIMARQLAVMQEISTNTKRLDRIDETLYYLKLNGIKML